MHYHMWRSYKHVRLHMHACIGTVHVSIEKYHARPLHAAYTRERRQAERQAVLHIYLPRWLPEESC